MEGSDKKAGALKRHLVNAIQSRNSSALLYALQELKRTPVDKKDKTARGALIKELGDLEKVARGLRVRCYKAADRFGSLSFSETVQPQPKKSGTK
jgi:hypothetical protein